VCCHNIDATLNQYTNPEVGQLKIHRFQKTFFYIFEKSSEKVDYLCFSNLKNPSKINSR